MVIEYILPKAAAHELLCRQDLLLVEPDVALESWG